MSLALSLHAPNQELRQSIVPSARAYKLDKLMAAVDKYEQSSRQKVTSSASLVAWTHMHTGSCCMARLRDIC